MAEEAKSLIDAMSIDEQRELIALSLIGLGDYAKEKWVDAVRAAGPHPDPTTADFLLQNPNVSDALEDGLSVFGFFCAAFDESRSNATRGYLGGG